MDRLLIIDGHAYAYRAFHAIRELRAPDGRATNAIYGFIKMLEKMREKLKPSRIVVVWDGGLSPERMSLLPEYKAQRPSMPEDLAAQLDEIVAYLDAVGILSICQNDVEADDLIGSLAQCAAAAGDEVVIASSDKDFMQLVSDRIGLLNPNDKSETIWGAAEVQTKAGVAPSQIVDWLSLVGDTVDNIPGVPGVGVKTAASLLARFGSIESLYDRIGDIPSERTRQALLASREQVARNQSLVRLKTELACNCAAEPMQVRPADLDRLANLYRAWGFKSMLAAVEQRRSTQAALF